MELIESFSRLKDLNTNIKIREKELTSEVDKVHKHNECRAFQYFLKLSQSTNTD